MDQATLNQTIHQAQLDGWEASPEALNKTYTFENFADAIAYMAGCQVQIDALNHHPEWTNVYNKVSVTLKSHDAGNVVTEKDISLAQLLDRQASNFAPKA